MRALVLLLVLLFPFTLAVADFEKTHTGIVKTKHLEVHYRPGSRAAAAVDRVAAMAERDLAAIWKALEIQPKPGLALYLFDDLQELWVLTATEGNGGFSGGHASYVPYDNDQTRFHELAHIVTYRLPKSGNEARNRFFPDGIANALLEYVHGVSVHAVAAFYERQGELPPLEDMTTGNFYTWLAAHPGFNAYDVGGSWFRYLLDTYGAKRVKRYYTGTSAKKAFGVELSVAERAWRKMLDAYELRPEVELLLRKRAGESTAFEPFAPALWRLLTGSPADWTSLMDAELRPGTEGKWSRQGDVIAATNVDPRWEVCELGTETFGDCAIRARIKTPRSCAIQVRLGDENQAMLVNATFLYRGTEPVTSTSVARMDGTRKVTDFLLVRRKGRIQIWIDGALALTAPAAGGPSPVGIAIFQGAATFEDVKVRRLP